MRVSAQFEDLDTCVAAHQAVLREANVEPDDIELRSSYPVFEEPLPPHHHKHMHLRNLVRLMWFVGGTAGFSLVYYGQTAYPIKTSGHPIVPLPIDGVIVYECAQITALIMTTVFFFLETNSFRQRPIPQEEDFDVATGELALVIGGANAEKAKGVLEKNGARIVRTFASWVFALSLFAMSTLLTGCFHQTFRTQEGPEPPGFVVRMRAQPSVRDDEKVHEPYAPGVRSMPSEKDPDLAMPEPYGRLAKPEEIVAWKKEAGNQPKKFTPKVLKNFKNPYPTTDEAMSHAQTVYQTNCQQCHGPQGLGDGPVGLANYLPPPAKLANRHDLITATDGDLFWDITVAPYAMPVFGTKLTAMDRWAVVSYLRKLQADEAKRGGAAPETK
jgi:mono/diheme cytochrome c family protein